MDSRSRWTRSSNRPSVRLAHRFERLIRDGEVRDYADLARLGHVTRARLAQIMNLLNLAPDTGFAFSALRNTLTRSPSADIPTADQTAADVEDLPAQLG